MSAVGYPAAPDDNAELLIEEARQRQLRRWGAWAAFALLAAAVAVTIFFLTERGSGSGGRPSSSPLGGSVKISVTKATQPPRLVSGAMTEVVNAQRRTGQAILPTISDSGLTVNRKGRVYV